MAKTIKLHEGDTFTSKRTFTEVLSLPPQGMNVGEMRRRMKVMDKIEAATGEVLTLEDAEYDIIKSAFQTFPFRLGHKDLVAIDDTINTPILDPLAQPKD